MSEVDQATQTPITAQKRPNFFRRAFNGRLSLGKAYWMVNIAMSLIVLVVLLLAFMSISAWNEHFMHVYFSAIIWGLFVLYVLYKAYAHVCVWRCAKNATIEWRYIVKMLTVINVILLFGLAGFIGISDHYYNKVHAKHPPIAFLKMIATPYAQKNSKPLKHQPALSAKHRSPKSLFLSKGDPLAQLKLGHDYLIGHGVKKNAHLAFKWLHLSAMQDNVMAEKIVAWIYLSGHGTKENDHLAFSWYQKAQQQHDSDAEFMLALMYADGTGTAKSQSLEQKWLLQAAKDHNARAQYSAGSLYRHGEDGF